MLPEGHISTETLTETYGVLKVGSGTVAIGQQVTGAGVLPLTAIESNLSGSGAGSTWLVNYAQTVASENMTMTGAPLHSCYGGYREFRSRFSRTATSSTTHHQRPMRQEKQRSLWRAYPVDAETHQG